MGIHCAYACGLTILCHDSLRERRFGMHRSMSQFGPEGRIGSQCDRSSDCASRRDHVAGAAPEIETFEVPPRSDGKEAPDSHATPKCDSTPRICRWAQLHPSEGPAWWSDLMKQSRHRLVSVGVSDRRQDGSWHTRSKTRAAMKQKVSQMNRVFSAVRGSYDGVMTHFPPLAVAAGLACSLKPTTMLVCHNFNLGHLPTGVKRRLASLALRRADRVIVHSRGEAALYASWFDLPSERFVFLPLHRPPLREAEVDIPDGPYVYAAGSAHRDYASLIEACRRTRLPTVIVAGWMHEDVLRELPPNVQVRSGLTMQQCNRLLRRARVNVVPLKEVPTAAGQVALVSGLLAGTPTLATRAVGTIDYVRDGATGLLYESGDVTQLADRMERLWHDGELRRTVRIGGTGFAESALAEEAGAKSLIDILDSTFQRRIPPSV